MIPPPPLNIVPSVIATVIRNPFIKGAPTRSKIRPARKRDLGAMVLANETKTASPKWGVEAGMREAADSAQLAAVFAMKRVVTTFR
jgi:hypothetical protein